MTNGMQGVVTSWKSPTQLEFQLQKRNKRKAYAMKETINNKSDAHCNRMRVQVLALASSWTNHLETGVSNFRVKDTRQGL